MTLIKLSIYTFDSIKKHFGATFNQFEILLIHSW